MSFKQSGSEPFTSTNESRDLLFINISTGVFDKVIGPMPIETFFAEFEFLPILNEESPPLRLYREKMETVSNSNKEEEMYAPFVEAIKPLCPNFHVEVTHRLPFTAFGTVTIMPDICIYDLKTVPKDELQDITKVGLMLELKYRENDDPFSDAVNKPLVKSSNEARITLGQITYYASAHQAAQFRSHVFSLLVFPRYARILRWDRSGVIVTEKVPLSSNLLLEFFHRYNSMTPERRGIDTTATMLSPDVNQAQEDSFKDQLSVNGSLYIARHKLYMDNSRSPFSRSTRGFIAYSVSEKEYVFVKDTWRLSSQTPEHQIYAQLKENNVDYIATVLNSGDILDQQTRTQNYTSASWAKDAPKKLRKHFHYRLVLKEIGLPLKTFSSTRLLVSVIRQALIAHKQALDNAKILHRDISANNILIYEGKALLIDWDLSKDMEDPEQARDAERTGTWQFMAARWQSSKTVGPHTITDDIESFVYVLTWIAFKYARHNMSRSILAGFLQNVFDYAIADEDGSPNNARHKEQYLKDPVELEDAQFESENLVTLLRSITWKISTLYRYPPSKKLTFLGKPNKDDSEESRNKKTAKYEETIQELRSSNWIIDLFDHALRLSDWPENDYAQEHEISRDVRLQTATKRSQQPIQNEDDKNADEKQEDKPASKEPPTKRPRYESVDDDKSKLSHRSKK
ncbi:hypothetical protein Clacol_005375 [Clathrus columnatus]|uniref:Fungal-type protein kinase domain-containing protein n=1 Tax=Clathrus columnatus TaxID=1419009 RepID=A0AAV5A950_9AGAM|nr:hypothetical protein Clacol_005375 [Clathrus columnatus]